jgi:hypothetical protein
MLKKIPSFALSQSIVDEKPQWWFSPKWKLRTTKKKHDAPKKHDEQKKFMINQKRPTFFPLPSWNFLKILHGGITYELHWSTLLRLMFLQPIFLCVNVLSNTPFHNHIQATLTSKVAFKIMEYRFFLQKVYHSKKQSKLQLYCMPLTVILRA